jgi:N-methylhydantoinase A
MSVTIGIDIGGTFTDAVVIDDAGTLSSYKSPTTPEALLDGVVETLREAAVESVERLLAGAERIGHGTTAATNAYIERRGARTALLTTRGFEDIIFQQRMLGMTAGLSPSELTDYSLRRVPEPLCPRAMVFGIRERMDYRGEAVGRLREEDVREAVREIAAHNVEAVAISFLWSFKNPAHERRAAEIVRDELPDVYVSVSHELVPRLGEYERTATTLVNAYLGPVMSRYTEQLERRLPNANLVLLDSGGGVMAPGEAGRAPVRLLLSGPSGGVTASQHLGEVAGHRNVITFDMGGTSTDVGLIVEGKPVHRLETEIGKYHLLLPMIDVSAIGAGGGSIARVEEGGYLRVGPASAGAVPGPACYGRGGSEPTVTDADLVLGILDPDNFLGGRIRLDPQAARDAIEQRVATPLGVSVEDAAAGIKRIVDGRMADLLRTVTLERGHDPREFVLYAFGGAGPSHAPSFALELVEMILIPSTQSVHSALGAAFSNIALKTELAVPMRISRDRPEVDHDELEMIFTRLEELAREGLSAQHIPSSRHELSRIVEVRFVRQTKALSVPYSGSVPVLLDDFLRLYAERYGEEAVPELAGFELVTFVVEALGRLPRPVLMRAELEGEDPAAALRGRRPVYDPDAREIVQTPIYAGPRLRPGNLVSGPAVIEYPTTTVALGSSKRARVNELLGIEVTASRPQHAEAAVVDQERSGQMG